MSRTHRGLKSALLWMTLALASCTAPAPKTGLDPQGLGMDSVEYLFWVLSLPEGPPLSVGRAAD